MVPLTAMTAFFGSIDWTYPSTFESQPECNSQITFVLPSFSSRSRGLGSGLVLAGLQSYMVVISLLTDATLLVQRAPLSGTSHGRLAVPALPRHMPARNSEMHGKAVTPSRNMDYPNDRW